MSSARSEAIRRRLSGTLLGAIGTAGVGAASVRVAAAIKDVAVAHRFGTGDALEAFLLAFALPVYLASSFRSAFFGAFVPRFLQTEAQRGPEAAREGLRRTIAIYLVVLGAIAVMLATVAGPISMVLAREFAPAKRELTRRFIVLLSPFVLLDGMAGMFTAALYAKKRYAKAIGVSAIPPLLTLACVIGLSPAWGVDALVLGAVAGACVEAAVSCAFVRRLDLPVTPALVRPGPEEFALVRGFGLLLAGSVLLSANTVIDQAMATLAGAGSVAVLGYGAKIPAALLGIAAAALGTVTLPHYAEFVAARQYHGLQASVRRHATLLAIAGLAMALFLALISLPLVRLLFEHGSFVSSDTARVSAILALYAFQIPGFIASLSAARCLNALGRDRWLLYVSALNFLLNLAGNWILLRWIGLPGIALSTAIMYTVAAALLVALCGRAARLEASKLQTP